MSVYHIIRSEDYDWIALYRDGKCVHQGHSIQEEELLDLLGIEHTHEVRDLSGTGWAPDSL